jgi:hypothetical protein
MFQILNNYSPMLFYASPPFDSDEHIFELKLDGMRCISYIGENIILKSRNGRDITALFPELFEIGKCVKQPCVLDGELVILKDGKPHLGSILGRNSSVVSGRWSVVRNTGTGVDNIVGADTIRPKDNIVVAAFGRPLSAKQNDNTMLSPPPTSGRPKGVPTNPHSRPIVNPVQYVVFDILWLKQFGDITHLPLTERKKLLS